MTDNQTMMPTPAITGLRINKIRINKVQPHPDNPRRGNLETIVESLREHGQYRPLVVQRSTGYILAGNHTWQAARELGWTQIEVTYVDVDDARARKILLIDNRASDLATYDDEALLTLLQDLDDIQGTGYEPADLEKLAASLDPDPTPIPDENRNHFQLVFPCTEEQRDLVHAALAKIQADQDLGSNLEALVRLAEETLA